jgi:hypothetical protein
MADNGSSSPSLMQRAGPVVRTFKLFMIICMATLALQVWVNPPERRGKVACWPPYKFTRWVAVDGLRTFVPKEHALHLKTAMFMEKAFHTCIGAMEGYAPGFQKSTQLPIDTP